MDEWNEVIDYLEPIKLKEVSLEELLTYPYKEFLNNLQYFSKDELQAFLNNEKFLNKLFLLEPMENVWQFEEVPKVYSFNDLLPFMQGTFLTKLCHRPDQRSYVYLVTFIRNEKTSFKQNIFQNPEFLNFFIAEGEKIYSELIFDYDFTLKIINYIIKNNLKVDKTFFQSLISNSLQNNKEEKKLLEAINDNNIISDLLSILDKEVVEDYLKNNVVGLTTGEVFRLMFKVKVPYQMYQNKDFFIKHLLNLDLIKMDKTIEELSVNNNVIYFKSMKDKMLKEIINCYDVEKEVIVYEPVEKSVEEIKPYEAFLNRYIFVNYNLSAEEKTKKLLANVVINLLFGDTLKNVCMDIYEMLSFNNHLNPSYLSQEKIAFYQSIEKFYIWDSKTIYDFYEYYKNYHVAEIYYDDMRYIKDLAYEELQSKCLDINEIANLKNKQKSLELGVNVYELNGPKFNCLVSCQPPQLGEYAHRVRKCYSLISNTNLDVFDENAVIYGYKNFPTENIIHVLERDALSGDTLGNEYREYTNRIRTNEEILGTKIMNEIQIANIFDQDTNKYKRIKPDYIVCFDEVDSNSVNMAKKLDIPIVIINRKLYQERDKTEYKEIPNLDFYSDSIFSDNEYKGYHL